MIRCPACGIRLPDAAARCPAHGAVAADAPEGEASPALSSPPPELPGYAVRGFLGQGGLGAVFGAERLADGVRVAIKVARADQPSASLRLREEEKALAAIGPPTVPAVYASGDLPGGAAYVVMELVRAPTLAMVLAQQRGPLPLLRFAALAPAIVGLIGTAHRRGFIHCDLKPENIFVGPFDPAGAGDAASARLFDFGLARQLSASAKSGEGDGDGQRTATAPEGTPDYMSPEQCEERGDIDVRSDIYSLGIILYEMCCGAPPFWGNPTDVQQSQRSRRPPAPGRRADVAPALEEIILRCLAKDPSRRFASTDRLLEQLRAALSAAALDAGNYPRGRICSAPAAATPKAKTNPTAAPRERRALALVFFESKTNVGGIRELLPSLGAQLAHAAADQYVVAFGHEVGDNPSRSAVQAAQVFIDRGFCQRALVDLASVSIQTRPDGTRRYQSALLQHKEQYPGPRDPPGVMLSAATAEMLPELSVVPVPGRAGVRIVQAGESVTELSNVTRVSAAPLVGRDQLLLQLLEAARAATGAAIPTITTVIAEPGHGKSHLASVLLQQLQSLAPRIEVLFIRAKEVAGGGQQATREIFRRVLGMPSAAPADLGRGLLAERLGGEPAREVWAGVAVAMGWVAPDHPEIRVLAAAPGALRSATARAAGEALRAGSRKGPLAVVIEDAHFADETALDALEFATLQEAACPLWVCVLGRPAFGRGRTAWASRAARRERIDLPPLDGPAALELARRLLSPAENVPSHALAKLVERTRGIPLLMVELVRGLKRDGLVRKSERTGAWLLAADELERLPDLPLVEWLASRETASLPPALVAHARLASVLGAEFTSDELDGVMRTLEREGIAPDTQLDAGIGLHRLTDSGLLVHHRLGRVGFRHALLREAVYQTVPPAQREQIHGAAFQYYRDAGATISEEERLPHMALHAARSGQRARAAGIYVELAGRAERRHAYLDAELLYSSTLENLADDDGPGFIRAAQGRGLMRFRLGRPEDALNDLAGARARVRGRAPATGTPAPHEADQEVELLLDESTVFDFINDFPRAAALTAEAGARHRSGASALLEARLCFAQARTLHRQERAAEAAVLFEQSVSVAERVGSDGYETMVQARNLLGFQYAVTGRYDDAERTFAGTVAICEAAGDAFNLTVALQNRGIVWMLSRRLDRMLEDYRRLMSIAREFGFPLVAMLAQKDTGEVHLMAGDLDGAERASRQAIEIARCVVGERSRGTLAAELLLARVLVFQGRLPEARALAAGVKERQRQLNAQGLTEGDFGPTDALLQQMVELATEGSTRGDWEGLVGRAKIIQQPQDAVEVLEVWGMTALGAGRTAEAARRLGEALELAERSAVVVAPRVRARLALTETGGHPEPVPIVVAAVAGG